MLEYHGFLPFQIKIYNSTKVIPGMPFRWNERKGNFSLQINKKLKGWLFILLSLFILNVLSVKLFRRQGDIVKFSLGILGLVGTACMVCLHYILISNQALNEILAFFNGLLKLEMEFGKAGKNYQTRN